MPLPDKLHLFEEIFRHAPVACLIIDEHDSIVSANKKIEDIIGYSKFLLEKKPLSEFIVHHRDIWKEIKQEVERVGYFRRETIFKRNDGKEVNVKYEIVKIACKRLGIFYAFFVRDVTGRSKTETLYKHFFDHAEDYIYTVDRNGRLTSVNPKLAQALGYTQEELIGHMAGEVGILQGENKDIADQEFHRRLSEKSKPTERYSFDIVSRDGTVSTIEVSAVPIFENGVAVGMHGIARDITVQRQYEQKLLALNRELEEKVQQRTEEVNHELEIKDRFLSDVSHELRTPLTLMQLIVEDMEDRTGPSEECIILNNEIERLRSLLDDVSLLLHPHTIEDVYPLNEHVDASGVVEGVIERLLPWVHEKLLTIDFDIKKLTIISNNDLFERLVLNLLTNAIKYSHTNGVISVRLYTHNEGVILEVEDFGIGISKEKQKLIFERFYRADHSRERVSGGIGLGLAIVKWIVNLHSGSIEVESEEGKGALFRVSIPRIKLLEKKG